MAFTTGICFASLGVAEELLRALFKAADFCTAEPEKAARRLVDGGFSERYD